MRRAAIGMVVLGGWACQGMGPDPGAPVPAAECHVEVANQLTVPISVTASGRVVRNLGSIPAGGSARYAEDCRAGTIRVVATIQEVSPGVSPADGPPLMGASDYDSRTEVQAVHPKAGELVRVVFRGRRVRRF